MINLFQTQKLFSSSSIPVSKIILQLQFHIYAMVKTFLPKQFTIWWMSLLLKQNFLWLDAESTKLFRFWMLNISLLLQIPYQLQDISLIHLPTHFNCIPLLYLKISEPSLTKALIIFWNCPSSNKWPPHLAVNKGTKQLKINPIFPCKFSWEFSKNKNMIHF